MSDLNIAFLTALPGIGASKARAILNVAPTFAALLNHSPTSLSTVVAGLSFDGATVVLGAASAAGADEVEPEATDLDLLDGAHEEEDVLPDEAPPGQTDDLEPVLAEGLVVAPPVDTKVQPYHKTAPSTPDVPPEVEVVAPQYNKTIVFRKG